MKAAVLYAFGQAPRWEEFAQPVPRDGEELIEVTAAPLNNIDRVRADGSHYSVRAGEHTDGGLPAVPGVIGAGRRPDGQRVLFGSRCGAMAQHSAARPEMTFPIPDGLDDAVAAAAWNPGLSAWLAFGWRCPVETGQTVLILGATGVTGQLAVQAARHFGAGRVVAAGRNRQVLDRLPGLGADATIQLSQPDDALAAAFAAQAGPGGYDLVVDYLWGHPTEVFCTAIEHDDAQPRSGRVRLLQAGEMAARPLRCRPRSCAARAWRSSARVRAPCRPWTSSRACCASCSACWPAERCTSTSTGSRCPPSARYGLATSRAGAQFSSPDRADWPW